MNNEITFFAKTNFRNQERVFGIKQDDRRRHMYIIGKTGMGKTNLLENLVVQDIKNGHGICYIDPHGDTADKLMRSIPEDRMNDVIYFNPADQQFPIAFNVMEKVDPEYRHLVASGLVGVFKKIWADSWGPRLEYILRNAILALLEYPGSTLLGVNRILVDEKYRQRVVERVTDPVVKAFWVDEFTKWNERVLQEVISPIQNKVGQFLSTGIIRNIVGQTKSSFDVRKAMDERKILILNLSKGRIGEDASALLGAMMITKVQLAAMGRVDIVEEERKDFYLYVDEFQNFATESFANILSEARKYRLNLILANQYVNQIDETVRDAIFGNAGTLISFRVGASDAEFLEKEFEPVFMQNDIVNLPKYNIYLKLMIDGIAGDAFSAVTLPPIQPTGEEADEQIVLDVSRKRYANSKVEVEEGIARWSGIISPEVLEQMRKRSTAQARTSEPKVSQEVDRKQAFEEKSKIEEKEKGDVLERISEKDRIYHIQNEFQEESMEPAGHTPTSIPHSDVNLDKKIDMNEDPEQYILPEIAKPKEEKVDTRPKFNTQCNNCGESIQVPFKPDGKRPTFCKECLKDYQRMQAKAKEAEERRKAIGATNFQENKKVEGIRITNEVDKVKDFRYVEKKDKNFKPSKEKIVTTKSYVSSDKPISLSQAQHIAPKKFKPKRERMGVDLGEVRRALENAKKKDE